MRSFLFLLFCLLLISLPAFSQLEKGEGTAVEDYLQLGYKEASELYRLGELDLDVLVHVAQSYRLTHDTENAEKWFALLVDESTEPLHLLYYAQALHSNGKTEQARNYYLKYDQLKKRSSDSRGLLQARAIDNMESLLFPGTVDIRNLTLVNSGKLDFSPALWEEGIVFVSNREPGSGLTKAKPQKDRWTGDNYSALYLAQAGPDGQFMHPTPFDLSLTSRFHEGPLCFSSSGDQLFFTANALAATGTEKYLGIYKAVRENDRWEKTQRIDLGNESSNNVHPSLSIDGRWLFFASDRPGGYGGMDLYVVRFSGDNWSYPVNLGPSVNTAGHEVFPFIHPSGRLYFASDGWGGRGALDICYADRQDGLQWGQATNLGAPFNSPKDDFGYISNAEDTQGYFSSARPGGLGKDDIYRFNLTGPGHGSRQFRLIDQLTGHPVGGARITFFAEKPDGNYAGYEGEELVTLTAGQQQGEYTVVSRLPDPFAPPAGKTTTHTNEQGLVEITTLPADIRLLKFSLPGYQTTYYPLPATGTSTPDTFYFQPTHCIPVTGVVSDKQTGRPLEDISIFVINTQKGLTHTLISGAEGTYKLCLPCGSDFFLRSEKEGYLQNNSLLTLAAQDCDRPEPIEENIRLTPIRAPSGEGPVSQATAPPSPRLTSSLVSPIFEAGVLIELDRIYYDFDAFDLQPPSVDELNKVIAFMKRHPDISAEIRSHTDSRGDEDYNRRLSTKRARYAVQYMVEQGIEPNRLTAKGYGEDLLINHCSDGVECPEEAHRMNRRTEVVLIEN